LNYKFDILLKNNKETLYEKYNIYCKYKDNIYTFKDKEVTTSFSISKNNFMFQRKTEEYLFKIEINNDIITSQIELIEENSTLDIPINCISKELDENHIIIEYKLDINENINTLIITRKED
jgi:hypothetical protein